MKGITRPVVTIWSNLVESQREWALLLLIVLIFGVLVQHFRLTGLGEPDSARLVNDAFVWHATGSIPERVADYRAKILPLSIIVLKKVLDFGVPIQKLPSLLNSANAVAGPLMLIPLFWIWRRLTDGKTALLGILLTIPVPAFWIANLYGYPHLPSLSLAISSLAAFLGYLQSRGYKRLCLGLLAAALMCLATCVKADTILLGGVFFGLVYTTERRWFSRQQVMAGVIVFLAAALPLVLEKIAIPVTSDVNGQQFLADWSHRFPLSRYAFFGPSNLFVSAHAGGPLLLLASFISAGILLTNHKNRELLLIIAMWSIPSVFFWGMRPGNSARHLLLPLLPLGMVTATAIRILFAEKCRQWGALCALLIGSYVSTGTSGATIAPGSNLFSSPRYIQKRIDSSMALGSNFQAHGKKVMVVGGGANPYMEFGIFSHTNRLRYLGSDGPHKGQAWEIEDKNGQSYKLLFKYVTSESGRLMAVNNGRKRGFEVVAH